MNGPDVNGHSRKAGAEWPGRMWEWCSPLRVIRETQKKTPVRFQLKPTEPRNVWTLTTPGAGEHVAALGLWGVADGRVQWYRHSERPPGQSHPENATPGCLSVQETQETHAHWRTCVRMSPVALPIIAQTWEQPKRPSQENTQIVLFRP